MAIKKIIDWAGNSWIVTVLVLVWLARRWIGAGLVIAGMFFLNWAEKNRQGPYQPAQVREYERYKTE